MRLYARHPTRAAKQVAGDLLAAVAVVLAVRLAIGVHGAVSRLGAPGRELAEAGAGLIRVSEATGGRLDDLPLVGDALRTPLDLIAGGGRSLVEAGAAQQAAVADLALILATAMAALPLLAVVALWLPRRVRWVREATAATALVGTEQSEALLAWRAVTTRPLRELLRVEPDPWGALQRGEVGRLAELERAALGLGPATGHHRDHGS